MEVIEIDDDDDSPVKTAKTPDTGLGDGATEAARMFLERKKARGDEHRSASHESAAGVGANAAAREVTADPTPKPKPKPKPKRESADSGSGSPQR